MIKLLAKQDLVAISASISYYTDYILTLLPKLSSDVNPVLRLKMRDILHS